jgi:hypothetical protein
MMGAIPASERAALIAFYHSTNGDNWDDNSGWKDGTLEPDGFGPAGSENSWWGVGVSNDHVTSISLHFNNLNGTLPATLENLVNLETLSVASNHLEGSIPPELGNLAQLENLDLGINQFTGGIPAQLGSLSQLESLSLEYNRLTGNIPPQLGNLINLNHLSLGFNRLSGGIPSELGNLASLTSLDLYYNDLTGDIPAELGKLVNLGVLRLSSNHLTGRIPAELGDLVKLTLLWLDSNRLTGRIPNKLIYLEYLEWDKGLNIGYNGLYAHNSTLISFLNNKDRDWESTQTIAPTDVYAEGLTGSSIRVSWTPIVYTQFTGGYNVYYSASPGGPWKLAGTTENKSSDWFTITGLNASTTYYIVINTQTHANVVNKNSVVSDWSEEVSAATGSQGVTDANPPFGSFDTPLHGSTVSGGIPVTGWALDDSGVQSVKIHRLQDNAPVYIGDAVMVEGARPDVTAAYPDYPGGSKAGWGYMMLTHFLPDGGNGAVTITATAMDITGKTAVLGSKTITCDNANAVKPFGAIDTPAQGGTVSGNRFINWGWVLTPQPNSIPTDGSTINVIVDGVNIGHPVYNLYRSDIANLFPGYANIEGAIGYFYLDTSAYEDGVHTIQWTAADSGGNSGGIGSRYFTINNAQRAKKSFTGGPGGRFSKRAPLAAGGKGNEITIESKELQRLEIHFPGPGPITNLTRLPTGSTLDRERGIFYWLPGPGFIGEYRFVFVSGENSGNARRQNVTVKILPLHHL